MFRLTYVTNLVLNRISCEGNLKTLAVNYCTPSISLGKSKKPKVGPTIEKKVIPVETDPNKLLQFVCGSNILKEGTDIEVKPDSEYPDWLWNLHTGKPLTLEELDPNTMKYWKKVRQEGMKKKNKLISLRKY